MANNEASAKFKIKKTKKALPMLGLILVFMLGAVAGGFFMYKKAVADVKKKLFEPAETFSKDIATDLYKIGKGNNVIKLGVTLLFNNENCMEVFVGKEAETTSEEGATTDTTPIGEKITKDIIIKTLNDSSIEQVSNVDDFKKTLIKNINKYYSTNTGATILKDISFTSYYFK